MTNVMMEQPQEPPVSNARNSGRIRKVSIADGVHGHDNPVFESVSRKTSAASEHVEIGPVRKKSLLHKNSDHDLTSLPGRITESGKQINGDNRYKKHSVTESVYSKSKFPDAEDADRSWWYIFCVKCRSKDNGLPPWHPPFWPKLCPYPYCPTYRQFTRIISLSLIGLLSWCILYSIVGSTAAPPNGALYQLIILSLLAHFGGWLVSLTRMPALIGMLFTGLLLQNVNIVNIDKSLAEINKELRNVALVIILTRAGLDLDPHALRRLKFALVQVGILPWSVEAAVVTVLSVFFLELPWSYAFLLGSIVAAVSPAVVVPCLFRLRSRGYGVAKGIPTLIIAIAGIADAVSVAFFGIGKSIMFSTKSLTSVIIEGPLSVIGGIGFGIIWGLICNYSPERNDPFVVPLRIILLLVGGTVSVFGSDVIGYGGAGPLGCVSTAFVCVVFWSRQGWSIEENPAATAFEIFWMVFEPILFGITGASIKINELDGSIVSIGIGILVAAALIRISATVIFGIRSGLNLKEKIFVAMSCMSKATVQAALGPVTLSLLTLDSPDRVYAEKILTTCVLSIILTAPTSAILITLLGPKLLTKTKFPIDPEGWRRSHRPSIRDISIIDEEEERNDNHNITIESSDSKGTPVSNNKQEV